MKVEWLLGFSSFFHSFGFGVQEKLCQWMARDTWCCLQAVAKWKGAESLERGKDVVAYALPRSTFSEKHPDDEMVPKTSHVSLHTRPSI